VTVPLVEGLADKLRATVFEGEIVGHAEADSEALTVAETVEERQSVGEPVVDGVAEAQTVIVALKDVEPLTLRDIVPVGLKEGEVGALRVSFPVGDKEAV
jgi:hypothetical protein